MHKVTVRVKPGNVVDEVKPDGNEFVIKVKARATDGKANREVIKVLAQYLKVKPSQLIILSGERSRVKSVGIMEK